MSINKNECNHKAHSFLVGGKDKVEEYNLFQ